MTKEPLSRIRRVLVVEDDPQLRHILRTLIESMGLSADEADNAQDGIAMLEGDPEIDVVLLDLGLPPQPNDFSQGIAFLKRVTGLYRLTQVIVLTGQSEPQAARQAIESGATDFLYKPLDPALLKQSMTRAAMWITAYGDMLSDAKVPIYMVAEPSAEETGIKHVREVAMEKLIRTVLADTQQNVSEAARRLGMTREHLYYFMRRFGIRREED